MFKYALLIILLFPLMTNATKWVQIEDDPSHLIDMDSIEKRGNLTHYRTKTNALNEFYAILYHEHNCSTGQNRPLKEVRYQNIGDKKLNTTTYHSKTTYPYSYFKLTNIRVC